MKMDELLNVLSGNSFKRHRSYAPALRATAALAKFCEEHDRPVPALRSLQASIEADNRNAALRAFRSIPFGGMGTFLDWFPPVKFRNETPDYVWVVFEALTNKWYQAMTDLLGMKKSW